MTIAVTSNRHWRPFKYKNEVPKSVRKDYDWLSKDQKADGWMHYSGRWYHVSDVMRSNSIDGWQGYIGETYFSSIVVNFSDDGETYQIGLALA